MNRNNVVILLVEDNKDHAELTVRAFTDTDGLVNTINVVKDGEQALDYLYKRGEYSKPDTSPTPDLILLDIKLPKIDGIEVLKILKNDKQLKKIPVIILTTSENKNDIVKAYSEGANSYISKPSSFKEFIEKINDLKLYWAETNSLP